MNVLPGRQRVRVHFLCGFVSAPLFTEGSIKEILNEPFHEKGTTVNRL